MRSNERSVEILILSLSKDQDFGPAAATPLPPRKDLRRCAPPVRGSPFTLRVKEEKKNPGAFPLPGFQLSAVSGATYDAAWPPFFSA